MGDISALRFLRLGRLLFRPVHGGRRCFLFWVWFSSSIVTFLHRDPEGQAIGLIAIDIYPLRIRPQHDILSISLGVAFHLSDKIINYLFLVVFGFPTPFLLRDAVVKGMKKFI